MAEYRASLTREAYEKNPSQCLNVVRNIITDAEKGDPVARKIFAQSYMTKAPTEVHISNDSDNTVEILEQNGFSKEEAFAFKEEVKNRSVDIAREVIEKIIKSRSDGSVVVAESNE